MADIDVASGTAGGEQLAPVRLYTLAGCGACSLARRLLRRRRIEFEEVHGEGAPDFRGRLWRATGSPTVPQIIIDGEPIGGADALLALDRSGALMPRVRRERFPLAVVRRRRLSARLLVGRWAERYEARLLDRDGRVVDRAEAETRHAATELGEELRARAYGHSAVRGEPRRRAT